MHIILPYPVMRYAFNFLLTILYILLKNCDGLEYLEGWNYINLHCRDNNNKPVDWWYIYKPPSDAGPYLESGRNFTFITPDTEGKWQPSDRYITANSMLQHTISPLFRPTYSDHLAIVAYDEREDEGPYKGSSGLGILMADEQGGLWIGHTVPGLPDFISDRPTFPEHETPNGHMIMCLSLDLVTLNAIAASLRHAAPKITRLRVPPTIKSFLPDWDFMDRPVIYTLSSKTPKALDFRTIKKTLRATMMIRQPGDGQCLYKTFARTKRIVLDVYGHDKHTRSICEDSYSVRNMEAISLKYPETVYYINNRTDRVGFAVSTAAHWQRRGSGLVQYWSCTSSLENEDRSAKGGLILCVDDYYIWLSFDNLKIKEPEC